MFDLWTPLGGDVLEGGGTDDGEADEEDVSLRVGERAQPVVVLLARRVPQGQLHQHVVNLHQLCTPCTDRRNRKKENISI